jgi:hypothetical protein
MGRINRIGDLLIRETKNVDNPQLLNHLIDALRHHEHRYTNNPERHLYGATIREAWNADPTIWRSGQEITTPSE